MHRETPLVSVVIPAHNAGRYVAQTIESVLAQQDAKVEAIVVDDGSTDDTPEVLKRFGDRIRVVTQPNGGLGAARSAGMRLALGVYLGWLDADDLCHPRRIAVQAAILDARPEIDVVSSDFSAFDEAGVVSASYAAEYYSAAYEAEYYSAIRTREGLRGLFPEEQRFDGHGVPWLSRPFDEAYRVYSGDIRDTLVWANFVHPPTLMMRRAVFERHGDLDDRYGTTVDWEYLIRVSASSRFAYVEAPLLRYRLHASQMSGSKNTRRNARDILDLVKAEMVRRPELATRYPRKTRRLLARSHLRMAEAYAEVEKGRALRSLARSFLLNPLDRRLPRGFARLLAPRRLVAAMRQWKRGGAAG